MAHRFRRSDHQCRALVHWCIESGFIGIERGSWYRELGSSVSSVVWYHWYRALVHWYRALVHWYRVLVHWYRGGSSVSSFGSLVSSVGFIGVESGSSVSSVVHRCRVLVHRCREWFIGVESGFIGVECWIFWARRWEIVILGGSWRSVFAWSLKHIGGSPGGAVVMGVSVPNRILVTTSMKLRSPP